MKMTYSSNDLGYLCGKLAENTGTQNGNIFAKEVIITQSSGMTAWLKTELAKRNKVIANTVFMNQDALLSEIFWFFFKQKPASTKDIIRFKLYSLFGEMEFTTAFHEVAGYYSNSDLRRIQLAGKISDLFDQYQLYRPELIKKWENGEYSTDKPSEAEKWQQWLWKKTGVESRETVRNKILSELEKNGDDLKKIFPRISIFGITVFTKFHLEFFNKLSEHTQVDMYLCLPTDQRELNNDLLVSYGEKAKELAELVKENFCNLNDFKKVSGQADTDLGNIQKSILNNTNGIAFRNDGSVQINSCYTPAREVECLYNYLLDLFEKDTNLKPTDVLVMATDIDKYSPFVKAVFRSAPVRFPVKVSGAISSSDDSIVSAIEHILRFSEDDLTSEKVISLLEHKRIKKRFSVSDTDYIRSVVRNANIRFGRTNNRDHETNYVSWEYGLEKILLGYAMLTDKELPAKDGSSLFPYKDAEASESYDLLRLKAFVQYLEWVIDEKVNQKTMAEWKDFLLAVIENMIWHDDFEKEDRADVNSVYRSLSYIDNIASVGKVPFEVFLDELDSKLFSETREIKLNTGNITVSSPVPVRGIPFKVICFIGLDNEVFPRKDQYMGFDLMGDDKKAGDRNKKETDKYLFLDTILSARENLYLSYIGQNVKNNNEIPPSIVIDTLIDHLDTDKLLKKHPLHGFSSLYSRADDNRMFTYLYGSSASGIGLREYPAKEFNKIRISDFIRFFQAPVDWYFNNVLDIIYDEAGDIIDETEIFEPDSLQKWVIRKSLLSLREEDIDAWLEKGKKEGYLPLKAAATVAVEQLKNEMEYLIPAFSKLTSGTSEETLLIDLVVENIRITGAIESIYGKEFIGYSVSDYPLKYKIESYIKTLFLYAEGRIESARFIDKNGFVSKIPGDQKTAVSCITELLEYYLKGKDAPLLFTIRVAEKEKEIADKEAKAARKATEKGKKTEPTPIEDRIEKILEVFDEEAFPDEESGMYHNPYLQTLFSQKAFDQFGVNEIEMIRDFSAKLNLFAF
jgi:exodeoxyribonuclease V gamma subunit